MSAFALTLIYGLSGHIASNIGFGMQKVGASVLKLGIRAFASKETLGRAIVWLLGLALYGVGTVLVFQALSLGDAALISAISGVGLAALALFSTFVLHEPIDRRVVLGIGLIILGTVFIGLFGRSSGNAFQMSLPAMIIYMLGLAVAAGVGFVWSRKANRPRLTGFVVAFAAGLMGGSALLFHKAAAGLCAFDVAQAASVGCIGRMPYFYLGFIIGTVALAVIQYAYQFSPAIEVVPTYAGTYLLVPIFGGMLIYGETISAGQWPGVVAAAIGTVLLSRGGAEKK